MKLMGMYTGLAMLAGSCCATHEDAIAGEAACLSRLTCFQQHTQSFFRPTAGKRT